MNKKYLIILIVVVLAIIGLSFYYGLGLNNQTSDDSSDYTGVGETINFRGMQFRIPERFIEDSTNKNSIEIGGITYPTNIKNYY